MRFLPVLLAAGLLLGRFLWSWDIVLYDWVQRVNQRPVGENVIIVAIDQASIDAIGQWPWPRSVHAALVRKLDEAGARVIGYDVIFAEPSDDIEDTALADAVAVSGRVVLPVVNEQVRSGGQLREVLPLPAVAAAAASLGHVDHPVDRDAVTRSVHLRAGLGDAHWPSFAVAVLGIEKPDMDFSDIGVSRGATGSDSQAHWQRDDQVWINFAGPPGHFPRVSFQDILTGDFPVDNLRDRIVLVGATAVGLGDVLPTPVSGNRQPMPGVEIIANEIDTLHNALGITPFHLPWALLLTILPVFGFTQLLPRLPVRHSLGLMTMFVLGVLALSVIALILGGRWFPPMAAVAGILGGYVLWSWHRLRITVQHLNRSLDSLNSTRTIVEAPFTGENEHVSPSLQALIGDSGQPGNGGTGDHVDNTIPVAAAAPKATISASPRSPIERMERQIRLVEDATDRLRGISEFVQDSLSQMNHGILVADNTGRVRLINHAALRYFDEPDDRDFTSDLIIHYWRKLSFSPRSAAMDCLRESLIDGKAVNVEAAGPGGRDLLLRLVPFRMEGAIRGIIVDIGNITSIRVNENRRREFLQFLSHDLRSPLASIISAAQLAQLDPEPESMEGINQRIENNARKALKLADEFLDLVKVGGVMSASFERVDIREIIERAIATISDHARRKQISITTTMGDPLHVLGEAGLLERMLTNLLINAVKYSPEQASIHIAVDLSGRYLRCRVSDTGYGMTEEDAATLFTRFRRIARKEHRDEQGSGIGLLFAKTVVDQHHGSITVDSHLNEGTTFTVLIPADAR